MYVPSRRRCSVRVRTMTAFTTVPFLAVPSGEASVTEAVIKTPKWATKPVEPPSGRIICSLRAPELSATSSMDLIITAIILPPCSTTQAEPMPTGLTRRLLLDGRYQRRTLHNFLQLPPLQLGERTGLFDLHEVAEMRRAILVVGVELLATGHHPLVERVGLLPSDFDHDGLGHLGGDHFANQGLATAWRLCCAGCCCFGHVTFSPSQPSCWPPSSPSLSSSQDYLRSPPRRCRPPALSGAAPCARERCPSSARGFFSGSRSAPSSTGTSS